MNLAFKFLLSPQTTQEVDQHRSHPCLRLRPHQNQRVLDFGPGQASLRPTRAGSRGYNTTNESAGGYANPCLIQTITLHQNVQHDQEASPARFEGTPARIGHLAPRGRLRGRNGDREYQGLYSERALRVAEGECRKLTLILMFGQLEAKVFYPKGEIQRESYRTKDGTVRGPLPNDAISPLITNRRVCRKYPLITGESTT